MKNNFFTIIKAIISKSAYKAKTLYGFFLYHFVPRKSIVLIMGAMRSGTTLLKALLAEGLNVSHIEEVNYQDYRKYNKYYAYYQIYWLSKEKIIVLKSPGYKKCPFAKEFIRLKIIVLTRNIIDNVESLKKMTLIAKNVFPAPWDNKLAINYWCQTYESILNDKEIGSHDIVYIKYEDLAEKPVEVTKRLFSFIGSSSNNGVNTYNQPENVTWKWGRDDGGNKIKILRVVKPEDIETQDEELLKLLKESGRVRHLMNIFGYRL